jgi:PKD repeat protein
MEPATHATRLRSAVSAGLLAAVLSLVLVVPVAAADPIPPPQASFTFDANGPDVTFTDTSADAPATWTWDFGDGTTAAIQNPIHTYAAPGRYVVGLTVANDGGDDHVNHTVTIKEWQLPPDQAYAANLYTGLVRYQNPDMTSCVATATMIMLNEVARKGHKGVGFRWASSISLARQRSIMRWARARDTLEPGPGGTDPNGWRNALNKYGWGAYQDPATMTYQVFAYPTYNEAVKAAVVAMARYHRPVGMLGWAGGHAQVLHGYAVYGQDPATSTSFTVQAVYLTDPLRRDRMRNFRLSYTQLAGGRLKYRFRSYRQKDSPKDDPYTPGILAADSEWYGRFVIVAPVK